MSAIAYPLGRRVLIIGSPGAGKTTLGRFLAEAALLHHVQLDDLYWLPSWVPRSEPDWLELLWVELRKDGWIIDGNYSATLELRATFADTIVYLDLPTAVCLWRVVKRALGRILGSVDDLPKAIRMQNCPAPHYKLVDFLMFVAKFRRQERPKLLRALYNHPNVIHLSTTRQIRDFKHRLIATKDCQVA